MCSPGHNFGWKPLKSPPGGTILRRGPGDESRTVQAHEGVHSDFEGLTLIRLWREDHPPREFYTMIALDENDNIVATATGHRDAEVWSNILTSLAKKGYAKRSQPTDEA